MLVPVLGLCAATASAQPDMPQDSLQGAGVNEADTADSGDDAPQSAPTVSAPTGVVPAPSPFRATYLAAQHRAHGARRWFVIPRILDTLWRFPASIVDTTPAGVVPMLAITGSVLGLMWPAGPSYDVRFQDAVRARRTPRRDRAFVHMTGLENTIVYVVAGTGIALTGWLLDDERILEWESLMVEALGATALYTAFGKIMVGRDAPFRDRSGDVHGPRPLIRGTPSGHMANAYALLSVTAWYWNKPWLHVLSHALAIWFGMSLVYNDQHYVSDVLWGAGIGYYVGRWVVQHRMQRAPTRVPGPLIVPLFGRGVVGLSLAGTLDARTEIRAAVRGADVVGR